MKSVMLSIRPQWCEKITSGEKTIEVRKSAPSEVPFKAYIYATKPKKFYKCGAMSTSDELLWLANGKIEMGDGFKFWADGDEYQCLNGRIIGEFICDKVDEFTFSHYEAEYRLTHVEQNATCLNQPELIRYGKGKTLSDMQIIKEWFTRNNQEAEGLKLVSELAQSQLNKVERKYDYARTWIPVKYERRLPG